MTDDHATPPDRIHLFGQKPEDGTPNPLQMVAVLRWECPHCREYHPYTDSMNGEIVMCSACGKLSRPTRDESTTPLTRTEAAEVRKLLEW